MKILRLAGFILFSIGWVLEFIWFYEEFSNNWNYYYNHQVNFDLLVLVGALSLVIGWWLIFWKRKLKKQTHS
jgi:hypothetical protein